MTSTCEPALRADAVPHATNGVAVAAFVFSFLGWFFLSIPVGLVALHQIKYRAEDGRGLAIAALWTSVVWIGISVGFLAVVGPIFMNVVHPIPPSLH